MALVTGYVVQGAVRIAWAEMEQPDEGWDLVQAVRALPAREGIHVVFDVGVDDYVLDASERLIPRRMPDPGGLSSLTVGRPARIWIVRRVGYRDAYSFDPDSAARKFAAITAALPSRRAWTSSRGAYEIYDAGVRTGTLSQPGPL